MQAQKAPSGIQDSLPFVVIVSADAEWRAVSTLFADATTDRSPYGEFFYHDSGGSRGVVMQGGWGKIDAAASAQYAISRWRPSVVVNLGTCAGISGQIDKFDTVLAERTVVWESGAIARVASKNETRVLILRGVSDLVGEESDSETYGRPEVFEEAAAAIMRRLFDVLPMWIEAAVPSGRL